MKKCYHSFTFVSSGVGFWIGSYSRITHTLLRVGKNMYFPQECPQIELFDAMKKTLNLMEKIESVLSEVLPDQQNAINGVKLANLISNKLPDVKESTIRQYLTSLHNDPSSILAKIPGRQGYYKRDSISIEIRDGLNEKQLAKIERDEETASARDKQREEKFRAIFARYNESTSASMLSISIEHTIGKKREKGANKWKFPDIVLVSWEVGEFSDDVFRINSSMLKIRQSLGEQPFKLYSNELKAEIRFSNLRENFFQCVSNSKWAHVAQLVIAVDINDQKLLEELSRLGKSYDVTIVTYGLSHELLDELPDAKAIINMESDDFESKVESKVNVKIINTAKERDTLDWDHIKDLKQQNRDFNALFDWISFCLKEEKAYPYQAYKSVDSINKKY